MYLLLSLSNVPLGTTMRSHAETVFIIFEHLHNTLNIVISLVVANMYKFSLHYFVAGLNDRLRPFQLVT